MNELVSVVSDVGMLIFFVILSLVIITYVGDNL